MKARNHQVEQIEMQTPDNSLMQRDNGGYQRKHQRFRPECGHDSTEGGHQSCTPAPQDEGTDQSDATQLHPQHPTAAGSQVAQGWQAKHH